MFATRIDNMSTWHDEMKSACFNLPVRNFLLSKDILLEQHCISRIRQDNRLLPIDIKAIDFNICRDKPQCTACRRTIHKIPKDSRELCFVPGAEHGLPHELNATVDDKAKCAQILLEGLYRFGQPIEHGTQSDVQFERGVSLKSVSFDCAATGTVSKKSQYVNIYTNDLVRFPVNKK